MCRSGEELLRRLEQRMIAAAPIVLEATAEVPDDACELADGDVESSQPPAELDERSALAAVRLVSSRAASQMQLHQRHTSLNHVD